MKGFICALLLSLFNPTNGYPEKKKIDADTFRQSQKLLKLAATELVETITASDYPMFNKFPERKKILLNILPYENLAKFPGKDEIYKDGVLLSMDHQVNPYQILIYKPFFLMYAGTSDSEFEKKAVDVKKDLLMEASLAWGLNENEAEAFADDFLLLKKVSSNETDQPVPNSSSPPEFKTESNFFMDQNRRLIGTLRIYVDEQKNYSIGGIEINNYVGKQNQTQNMCLVAYFPYSPGNKILLTSAQPLFTNDFNTNAQNWYYLIKPWDESFNTSGCNNPEILASLKTKYPGAGVAFSLPSLYPDCTGADKLFSNGLELVLTTGEPNKLVFIKNLYFMISYLNEIAAPIGMECKSNQECQNLGYNCCSSGRCVKDKTLKSGVDLKSQEYLQSIRDILSQPSKILDYPNFYNLCAETVMINPDPPPQESSTALEEAKLRFSIQKSQYLCQEEGKKPNPNYELFCNDKYLCTHLWKNNEPSFDGNCADLERKYGSERYIENRMNIRKTCGCLAGDSPESPDNKRCPGFNFKAIRNSNGDILEIICIDESKASITNSPDSDKKIKIGKPHE